MRDITLKPTTLRTAIATGRISLPPDAVQQIRAGSIEKGSVPEAARLAGMMAVKRTPDLLPHCHPIGVLQSEIRVNIEEAGIAVEAEVQTIAATGVEMEALTAASVALLTVYDMLKAYAPAESMVIGEIRLLRKRGGKTQYARRIENARAAVLVLSDTVAAGHKTDTGYSRSALRCRPTRCFPTSPS
jgi:molybdenum cofactor biosynthesis protein MoaC